MRKSTIGLCFWALATAAGIAELPNKDPLTDLRLKWLAARKRALTPIDDAYLKQLDAMKVAETKKGNLDAAIRIDAERVKFIQARSMDETYVENSDAIRESLANSMWTGLDGPLAGWTLQLLQKGDVVLVRSDGTAGWGGWTWKINDDGSAFFTIPATAKPQEVKFSKQLDRMTLFWQNGTTFKRQLKK